jgi:hypothetical protein
MLVWPTTPQPTFARRQALGPSGASEEITLMAITA